MKSYRASAKLTDVPRKRTVRLALTATLAAVYLVFRAVPTFPNILFPGTFLRAGDIVAPLYGIILGPLLGPVAIIIGTGAGYFTVAPPVFLGLDFLPASVCAATVGLMIRRGRLSATVLYTLILTSFVLLPFTALTIQFQGTEVPYNWLHLVGLALLVSPAGTYAARTISRIRSPRTSQPGQTKIPQSGPLVASIAIVAFVGTLAQHLMGGILTEVVVGLNFHATPIRFASWKAFWTFVFYVYPIERSIITILAAILAAPVLVALRNSRVIHRLP